MRKTLLKFIKKLAIFTIIVGLISFVITFFISEKYLSPAMPYLLLFYFTITFFTYYLTVKALSVKTSQYTNFFMISVFGKLLIYISIIIIYAFANISDIVGFIITFFVFYLLFTTFETIEVIKVQRSHK